MTIIYPPSSGGGGGGAPSGAAAGDLTGTYPSPTLDLTKAHAWSGTQSGPFQDKGGQTYNAKGYGAKGDGRSGTDGGITGATFTSATANLTAADVGKMFVILGADTGGNIFTRTISSIISSTQATISGGAAVSVTNQKWLIVSDDTAAIQSALTACGTAGGGDVYLPPGTYGITNPGITPVSKVRLRGAGPGKTILAHTHNFYACIGGDGTGATSTTPWTDIAFEDFEIDGSWMDATVYSVRNKGLFILYCLRPVFRNLLIHDTGATGLGCDFMQYYLIENVTATGCGRTMTDPSTQFGASGIGIGAGAYQDEPGTVMGCHAYGNYNHGIFVEKQSTGGVIYRSRGVRIVNCYAKGNRIGVADKGVNGLILTSCHITDNTNAGVVVDQTFDTANPGTEGEIALCEISRNGVHGINVNSSLGGYRIHNNRVNNNTGHGILVNTTASTPKAMKVEGNACYSNTGGGIVFSGGGAALQDASVSGNTCYNNGTDTGQTYRSGITVNSPITRSRIEDNHCFDNGGGSATQQYGLALLGANTDTDASIQYNILLDNAAGALSNAHTQTNTTLTNNVGVAGAATVAAHAATHLRTGADSLVSLVDIVPNPRWAGYLGWTHDYYTCVSGSGLTPTAGVLYLSKIAFDSAVTLSAIDLVVLTAGTGATALANCFVAVYDSSGTRLFVSADQSSAWATTGQKSVSGLGLTAPAGGFLWVAVLVGTQSTTAVQFQQASPGGSSAAAEGRLTAATYRSATNGTAQTAAPATITPSSNGARNGLLWAGIY